MPEIQKSSEIKLEVMVAVYGREAIKTVASPGHLEPTRGVRYLLSWQIPDTDAAEIPDALQNRKDLKIEIVRGKGVSINRNNLLDMARAPYLLFADDDIVYRAESLGRVIDTFENNPDVDLAFFKVRVGECRYYPEGSRKLAYSRWANNFYPFLIEGAIRLEAIKKAELRFNEFYGTNAPVLGAGEEDVFFFDAWKKGLELRFFPIEILEHNGSTTVERRGSEKSVIMARGAVLRHLYGRASWIRIVKLSLALPGNKLNNMKSLRAGAAYEKALASKTKTGC